MGRRSHYFLGKSRPSSSGMQEPVGAALGPKAQGHQGDPEDDGINADAPDETDEPDPRIGREKKAEQDRDHTVQGQEPFAADMLAKLDRRGDLEHARDERPGDEDIEKCQGRRQGRKKRDQPSENADDSLQQKSAPALMMLDGAHRRDDREDAVDQRIDAEDDDQRIKRYAGPEEGDNPEQDRGDAAQRQGPPVLRQELDHGTSSP